MDAIHCRVRGSCRALSRAGMRAALVLLLGARVCARTCLLAGLEMVSVDLRMRAYPFSLPGVAWLGHLLFDYTVPRTHLETYVDTSTPRTISYNKVVRECGHACMDILTHTAIAEQLTAVAHSVGWAKRGLGTCLTWSSRGVWSGVVLIMRLEVLFADFFPAAD